MKSYSKHITYVLENISEIDVEIEKQIKKGWYVFKKSDITDSYLYPTKKEIEITYLLMEGYKNSNEKLQISDVSGYKSGDFDVWYQLCEKCGYDTGKSTKPKEGNKTCWRCGNFVKRDYSTRSLKKFSS